MNTLNTLNICKQRDTICQGQHVDPEYTLTNRGWELTDRQGMGPIVKTVERLDGESDDTFSARAAAYASVLDRELACSRCYR